MTEVIFCLWQFFNLKDFTFLFVGIILAIFTGGGLIHLTFCVGWILEILISVDNRSMEFRAQMFPFLAYYSFAAFVLGIAAFFQYICFRHVALKLGRRFRRRYFQLLLLQSPEFFYSMKNKEMIERFESDVLKLQQAFTDSLPTMISIFMQFLSAFGMSFFLSTKLSSPISILGLFVFLFVFILTIFTIKLNQSEQRILSQDSQKAIFISSTFSEWCNSLFSNNIKKAALISMISGSLWLFMFGGMGIGAW